MHEHAIGRTIARIEPEPLGDLDAVLIHFTDGTGLIAYAGNADVLNHAEVRAYARRAQGQREQRRLRRLQREEWLAISCAERVARKEAARERMDILERAIVDMFAEESRRWSFFGLRQTSITCERCGERECENTITVEPSEDLPQFPMMVLMPRLAHDDDYDED